MPVHAIGLLLAPAAMAMCRSSFFLFVGIVATAGSAGCGSMGPQIELEAEAARQRSAGIVTVDLLPVETRLWTYEEGPARADAVAAAYRSMVMGSIGEALRARRYRLASIIDRAGNYSVGVVRRAMTDMELADTLGALNAHAEQQFRSPGRLVPLPAPARLGAATGSQATLYVGGTGYVGDDSIDMADVMGALALFSAAATAVGTVGALADDGPPGERIARASRIAAEGAETTAELAEEAEYLKEARPVPKYPSFLRLVLTLVDNRTGTILWHSDRTYPYKPTSQIWLRRALELSLRKMPRGGWRAPRVRQHHVVR
jgi:hypothetical protein